MSRVQPTYPILTFGALRVYTIIPELLFQSARTHELVWGDKIALIQQTGINTLVNLWHRPDRALQRSQSIRYIHHYLPDGKTALLDGNLGRLTWLVAQICQGINSEGWKVLVHCSKGYNRSGLICAMVLRNLYSIRGIEAVGRLRAARPGALARAEFRSFVEGL